MKTIIKVWFFIFGFSTLWGQMSYKVEDVPNVQLDNRTKFVSDPARIVTNVQEDSINHWALKIRELSVETAVVALPNFDVDKYGSVEAFANELFNKWGIGDEKTDKGLLILLIANDKERFLRFEVGYGLEGDLPDGLCKLIQTKKMIPPMKEGDYGKGLLQGIKEVHQVLNGDSQIKQEYEDSTKFNTSDYLTLGALFALISAFFVLYFKKGNDIFKDKHKTQYQKMAALKQFNGLNKFGCALAVVALPLYLIYVIVMNFKIRKFNKTVQCEACKAFNTTKFMGKEVIFRDPDTSDGYEHFTQRISFVCKKCNHTHHYDENCKRSIHSNSSGSGSGSSSGSWGGGSSGGGGSTSRF